MLDRRIRELTGPSLTALGQRLAGAGVKPGVLTGVGWLLGLGACVTAADRIWSAALVLWLANRLFDGLDGPVARAIGATARGGFFDIVADFSVYGGFVVGVAMAIPRARVACLVLLFAYYVSGAAFLAVSSLLETRGKQGIDGRSFRFVGGLAEGGETVVVYVLFCLLPHFAPTIAWIFAAVVSVTAVQRVIIGASLLSEAPPLRAASREDH